MAAETEYASLFGDDADFSAMPDPEPPELIVPSAEFIMAPGFTVDDDKLGAAIDDAIEPPREPARPRPEPSSGIPKIDEWQDFFSRIVIRTATDWYISVAFRGIDEENLTEREIERISMRQDERDNIARPFAEFASKNPFMRKRGRLIVSTAGSIESLVTLGIWFSRVNRIAAKYRPQRQRNNVRRMNTHGSNGQGSGQAEENGSGTATGFAYFSPGSG